MGRILGIKSGPGGPGNTVFDEHIHEEDLPHFRKAIDRSMEAGSLIDTIFRTRPETEGSRYFRSGRLSAGMKMEICQYYRGLF
jgi:hypothetical protein